MKTMIRLLIVALSCSVVAAQTQTGPLDLLIRGGKVLDGTGGEPIAVDIGVRGDRIAFIGDARTAGVSAARTIDATGLVVAPGFIDPHAHAGEDLDNPRRNSNVNYLMQGVTTVVTGNDGGGPTSVAATFDRWEKQGIGTNVALLVGQGNVRRQVMGLTDASPTAEQLGRMKALVGEAMDGGAVGMSTGLFYSPGSYSKTGEVIELAKVVAAKGGVYDSHMRDESSYTIGLMGSIEEILRIGREANIPVNISHIKALGADAWGKSIDVIAMVQNARAEGVRVTADQYPYLASGSSVGSSLLPRWAEVGGQAELLKRIEDPATRQRLIRDMQDNLRRRNGAEALLITSSSNRALVGKTLGAIAKERNVNPLDAALDIIKDGGASVASFNMNDKDIENFMRQDWVMTGSDGSGGHPRKYGTYPRKLREYVYTKKIISLPFAVRASSSLVAETFRIPGRGRLTPGYFADIIVFNESTIADRSTYEQPELLAVGMTHVIVNGKVAVENGQFNGALAGRPIRK